MSRRLRVPETRSPVSYNAFKAKTIDPIERSVARRARMIIERSRDERRAKGRAKKET